MIDSLQELKQFIKEILFEITASDLIQVTSPIVRSRAVERPAKLAKVDRKNNIWNYRVAGSNDSVYLVKVKVLNKRAKKMDDSDILVTCNCPFFRWQGPEHWAKVEKYLYPPAAGTASVPVIRDPQGVKKICKHAVSALSLLQNVNL